MTSRIWTCCLMSQRQHAPRQRRVRRRRPAPCAPPSAASAAPPGAASTPPAAPRSALAQLHRQHTVVSPPQPSNRVDQHVILSIILSCVWVTWEQASPQCAAAQSRSTRAPHARSARILQARGQGLATHHPPAPRRAPARRCWPPPRRPPPPPRPAPGPPRRRQPPPAPAESACATAAIVRPSRLRTRAARCLWYAQGAGSGANRYLCIGAS
jgi:hypothetical protein